MATSRPVWGAWIEMILAELDDVDPSSRPVWGAWIEIFLYSGLLYSYRRRAPYGARGLKSSVQRRVTSSVLSRPVWGAWIEIPLGARGCRGLSPSRPVWGAWIEIFLILYIVFLACVAPRMGRVD